MPDLRGVAPAPDRPAFPGYRWTYRWRDGAYRWGQDLVFARSATTERTENPRISDLASRSAQQALQQLLARAGR